MAKERDWCDVHLIRTNQAVANRTARAAEMSGGKAHARLGILTKRDVCTHIIGLCYKRDNKERQERLSDKGDCQRVGGASRK